MFVAVPEQSVIDALSETRWATATYERFTNAPVGETCRLLRALGLPEEDAVLDHARQLGQRVTKAITVPRPDKWREENPDEVASILPNIAPTMERLGYPL